MTESCLRAMTEADLCLVRAWRNHSDIKQYMYHDHDISEAEHHKWFSGANRDPAKCLLIYELQGRPAGFVNITRHAECQDVADWGFYMAPGSGKGTGGGLGKAAVSYAFQVLELYKLCGQALSFNESSIRFHERLGFVHEGTLRNQFCRDGQRYSLICFGMLREEWQTQYGDEL